MNNSSRISVLIAVVILLVAVLVAVIVWNPAARAITARVLAKPAAFAEASWTAFHVPAELRSAQFISEEVSGTPVTYRVSSWRFVRTSLALAPEVQAVLDLPINKDALPYTATQSPEKQWLAFTQLAGGADDTNLKSWQVNIAMPSIQSQHAVGKGFSPFFLDETHLAFFTASGIVVVDPAATSTSTTTQKVLIKHAFTDVHAPVSISPNHSVVAFVDGDTISVYSILPDKASSITTYNLPFTSFGVGDTALYILNQGDKGTTISRYPFAVDPKEETLVTLPKSLSITSLKL